MFHPNSTRASIATAWLVALVAAIWSLSGLTSLVTLTAIAVSGAVPAIVVMTLARRPELTTSEAIRAVCTGRGK